MANIESMLEPVLISDQSLPSTRELHRLCEKEGLGAILVEDARIRFLRKHGDFSMAYSTLQADLDYFIVPEVGYVAYRRVRSPFHSIHVLADPVVAQENVEEVLALFLERFPAACFSQIGRNTAQVLHDDFGYHSNEAGIEILIDLRRFRISGRKHKDLKRWRKKNREAGVDVEEVELTPPLAAELRSISAEWISNKAVSANELEFLARPMEYNPEFMVRYAVAKLDDEVVAFNVYDPIFSQNRVVGYQSVIQRYQTGEEIPMCVNDYVHFQMIKKFREEGADVLSLGFSPFAPSQYVTAKKVRRGSNDMLFDKEFPDNMGSPYTNRMFDRIFEYSNPLYNFRGVANHKRRYRGQEIPVYFASRKFNPTLEIIEEYLLSGVISLQTIPLLMHPKRFIAVAKAFNPFPLINQADCSHGD